MSKSENSKFVFHPKHPILSKRVRKSPSRGSWRVAQNLPGSFRYAFKGLTYSFASQRNFRIHVFLGFLALISALLLGLDAIKFAIIVLTIAAVLVLELINTAIESVVDLSIGRRFHPLARIAKDCAAAGVLIASLAALVIALLLLFLPFLQSLGM